MLNQLGATEAEKLQLVAYFKERTVTNAAVKEAFEKIKAE
jgi:hydroxymethylglutaryl-CoA reductase